MYFYFTFDEAKKLSPSNFCIIIFILTPILVLISYITYNYIEKPFINYSKRINFKK
jgi:peptidoglycan/LPS O-acetylase OafA/YrhL